MTDPCGDYSLACQSCRQKFTKWQGYIRRIRAEVARISRDEEIFRGVVDVMESARTHELDATFYSWIGSVYQEAVSLRVRRLLDTDQQTFSLRVLLEDIAANPKVLSRERFCSSYTELDGNPYFDQLAGVGASWFSADAAESDLNVLLAVADRVKSTADKHFAHLDKTPVPSDDLPTWREVADCVEKLERAVQKYSALLLGTALNGEVRGELPRGWKNIFQWVWRPKAAQPQEL